MPVLAHFAWIAAGTLALSLPAVGDSPLVQFRGVDFRGGGQGLYGSNFYGRQGVNYVYAQPTGAAGTMTAAFQIAALPGAAQYLTLEATDDDASTQCHIAIALNGSVLFQGLSGYTRCRVGSGPISDSGGRIEDGRQSFDCRQPGTNRHSRDAALVHGCACGHRGRRVCHAPGEVGYHSSGDSRRGAAISRTAASRPKPARFCVFSGIKGWNWDPDQYLDAIPFLASVKMNFLMNCYLSLFSSRPPASWGNNWWNPLPDATKAAYAQVIQSCQGQGITFCFAMNPQLDSSRPLVATNLSDIASLYQNYAWAQSQGAKWFSLCLDDVSWSGQGSNDAFLVNTVFHQLRQQDPVRADDLLSRSLFRQRHRVSRAGLPPGAGRGRWTRRLCFLDGRRLSQSTNHV